MIGAALSVERTTARYMVGRYGPFVKVRHQLRRHGDVMLAVTLFLLAQVELETRHPAHDIVGVLRVLLLTLATVPLAWRRSHPLPAITVVVVAGAASSAAGGNVNTFYAIVAVSLIGFYSGGAYMASRSWLIALVGCLSFWADDTKAHHPLSEYIASAVLVIGPWLAGRALRHQRQQAARLRELAADLAEQRELAEAAAAAAERSRIAREMHDVVAHGLSIIAVQADAASAALERRPELAAAAVETIREVARESLNEMRRVLHVLHEDADELPSPPTLRDLDRLISRAREAGLKVEVDATGALDRLPAAVDLAAYRVVQEALTNVRKHSDAGQALVCVRNAGGELFVEVTNNGTREATSLTDNGYGLRGLRDRVEAHGGRLQAGPSADGWRIAATMPLSPIAVPLSNPPAMLP